MKGNYHLNKAIFSKLWGEEMHGKALLLLKKGNP